MAKSKRDAASPETGNLDRQAILDFVRQNPEQANKRAIAKHFGIKGGETLAEMLPNGHAEDATGLN